LSGANIEGEVSVGESHLLSIGQGIPPPIGFRNSDYIGLLVSGYKYLVLQYGRCTMVQWFVQAIGVASTGGFVQLLNPIVIRPFLGPHAAQKGTLPWSLG
jgi:hypothetical protein